MRISDWSSDVCSSDLGGAVSGRSGTGKEHPQAVPQGGQAAEDPDRYRQAADRLRCSGAVCDVPGQADARPRTAAGDLARQSPLRRQRRPAETQRSEENTTELQSLMRISYDVFCLKKPNHT